LIKIRKLISQSAEFSNLIDINHYSPVNSKTAPQKTIYQSRYQLSFQFYMLLSGTRNFKLNHHVPVKILSRPHLGRLCTWDQIPLGTMTDLGRICTWDQKVNILKSVTVRHLGPWRTWDDYTLGMIMHLGPKWRTWDQYALGTKSHLGPICTWDHDGLGTNMHLGPNHIWDQYAVGTNMHLAPKCTNMRWKFI
jgi:hypothetical protein